MDFAARYLKLVHIQKNVISKFKIQYMSVINNLSSSNITNAEVKQNRSNEIVR